MQAAIKIGFCIAYDWYFLREALPQVYADADVILLALDRRRMSWSGKHFEFDEDGFRTLVKELDAEGKITLYEDDFFVQGHSPMQNEVRQRNLMAARLGPGGWHIQLDCDEYFINFAGFVRYLRRLNPKRFQRTNVCCDWITLFRQVDEGFLIVSHDHPRQIERIAIATLSPRYEYGRRNGDRNHFAPFGIVHQSWARSEAEIATKLSSWGHAHDFDANAFMSFWKSLTRDSATTVRNFHPIHPAVWSRLSWVAGNTMREVLQHLAQQPHQGYNAWQRALANARWINSFRSRLSKLRPK
ncbi:MAG: hypothetical protein U0V64_13870 [Cyclobacteriaceae bacterium]